MNLEVKDPGATLEYYIDWSDWLEEISRVTGDVVTIAGCVLIGPVEPVTEPPLVVENVSYGFTASVVWLSGGKPGEKYLVTLGITTQGDEPPVTRTNQRTLEIYCEER